MTRLKDIQSDIVKLEMFLKGKKRNNRTKRKVVQEVIQCLTVAVEYVPKSDGSERVMTSRHSRGMLIV